MQDELKQVVSEQAFLPHCTVRRSFFAVIEHCLCGIWIDDYTSLLSKSVNYEPGWTDSSYLVSTHSSYKSRVYFTVGKQVILVQTE